MKTILLVNPWIYDFAAYDFWIKPLGLLYIASFLRKNGYHIEFIDCLDPWNQDMKKMPLRQPKRHNAGHGKYYKEIIEKPAPLKGIPKNYHRYGISPQIFRKAILQIKRPHLVLVTSMMTYWYTGVFEAIAIIKELLPGIPVVLGGNYATLCPDHAKSSGADFIVPGEGEMFLPPLMELLEGAKLQFIPDRSDLDSYPYPAFELIGKTDQLPVRSSRGCPYRCSYCASQRLNPGFRRRDPSAVFSEILHWHRHKGVNNFSFYDDAFLVDHEKMAAPLFREIIKYKLPCRFHCPNGLHLREINDEIAQLMFMAGFITIRFGLETTTPGRQSETGGKVTNSEFQNAVSCLKKAGYGSSDIGVYLLCGMPSQRANEIRDSIAYVRSYGARPILAEYSPIPGTALWEEAKKFSPFNIEEEPLYHNNSILPCRSEFFTLEDYMEMKHLTRLHDKSTLEIDIA